MASALSPVVFSSGKDDWCTPPELFMELDDEFHFELDAAASPDTALCKRWYGPGSPFGENALEQPWGPGATFCNPPYSQVANFVDRASGEAMGGIREPVVSVLLVPSRTDTKWWHRCVWSWNHPKRGCVQVEVRFLQGRVKFIDPSGRSKPNSAPFPSVVLVFRP